MAANTWCSQKKNKQTLKKFQGPKCVYILSQRRERGEDSDQPRRVAWRGHEPRAQLENREQV